jgi:hypothetical protein
MYAFRTYPVDSISIVFITSPIDSILSQKKKNPVDWISILKISMAKIFCEDFIIDFTNHP